MTRTVDGTFADLNMAEELHKRLDEINRQLKKLDNIEATVIEIRASFQKLEVRIQNLESSQVTSSHDIENLKSSLSDAVKKRQELVESLEKYQNETKQALTNLQKEKEASQAIIRDLEDKNLYLEAYSRRQNLKFENIVAEDNRENTEEILRDFLETELGYKDAKSLEIQRVHRLGKKKEGRDQS